LKLGRDRGLALVEGDQGVLLLGNGKARTIADQMCRRAGTSRVDSRAR
jgi:hypothetical protein